VYPAGAGRGGSEAPAWGLDWVKSDMSPLIFCLEKEREAPLLLPFSPKEYDGPRIRNNYKGLFEGKTVY
jgi:hypothetical protein